MTDSIGMLAGLALFILGLTYVFGRYDRRTGLRRRGKPFLSTSEAVMVAVCALLVLAALYWR